MAENQNVFVFIASYGNVNDALMDYTAVQQLYIDGVIDTYDGAVVQKDADGNVHVSKHEKPTQKGAWTGIAVGAVVGVLFPPAIIADGGRWRCRGRSHWPRLARHVALGHEGPRRGTRCRDGGTRRRRQIQPGRQDR